MKLSSGKAAAVLGDAVRDRVGLSVVCEPCGHRAALDPAALAERLGYDFPLPRLRRRLTCSKCGGREVAVKVEYQGPGTITRHGPGD